MNQTMQLDIDQLPKEGISKLPDRLWPFIWFFVKQAKVIVFSLMFIECLAAISTNLMFWYVGELVENELYTNAFLVFGILILTVKQVSWLFGTGVDLLIWTPYFGNMVRRQLYWYTARQSLSFFQNDFAGRIANKLLNGPCVRDAVRSMVGSVWFAITFTITSLWLMASTELILALPLALWVVGYIGLLAYYVPKIKEKSGIHADSLSVLTGQVVDSLTNFLPAKYFSRIEHEDKRVIGYLDHHAETFLEATRLVWILRALIDTLNSLLLVATAMICLWMIDEYGQRGLAAMAMALPMAVQTTFQSGWIMREVTNIFEHLGRIQDIVDTLSKPHKIKDKADARVMALKPNTASIGFENVSFHYGQENKVIRNLSVEIPAGQKVGLVGRSGAGKSTITSLIVRAYDVESGAVVIGGHDVRDVTQDSLRQHITVVTQDSYLFHRSVRENIRYGNLDATQEQIETAAKKAHAYDFILQLQDNKGRKAFDAHVGERGVKLSGGQKQRIAIARAILKDAPILILDEATSALDSESEAAIQHALSDIMHGKTVIAIAHRLSTLRQMDRLLVMEDGQIIEDGTHDELIANPDGHYAKLWHMQSGGFYE